MKGTPSFKGIMMNAIRGHKWDQTLETDLFIILGKEYSLILGRVGGIGFMMIKYVLPCLLGGGANIVLLYL